MVTAFDVLSKSQDLQERTPVIETDVGVYRAAKNLEENLLAHNTYVTQFGHR